MRVLDLFSGIGAMSLGLEWAGMQTVAFCEIDPLCRKLLAEKWPGVPCHDDVRTMQFPECDIIAGGFPCQDISVAGRGAGLSGERSGLYREVLRAIRLVGPKYVLLENVAVLLSRGLGTILGDLAEIGYDAEWYCIPASRLGAPHRRDRIWIVAYPNSIARNEGWSRHPEEGPGGRNSNRGSLGQDMAHPHRQRLALWESFASHDGEERPTSLRDSWWPAEPKMGRVVDGHAGRVDQLRMLGNSLLPQIPELIGRAIMAAEGA
jgi:DNA (cytosine-5)-methyltransferase 1